MKRILAAVNDSPPALAAAAAATALARTLDAELHFVAVTEPDHHAIAAIRHLTELAEQVGITPLSTTVDGGQPFEVILDIAQKWNADLIVMGRSDKRRSGLPYVGSQPEHLLEFTEVPVLIVPRSLSSEAP
jgi:nucleotide-binding universal stress UspA family protein